MKYLYTGPQTSVSLQEGQDVILHSGKEYDLPEDNSYVKTLIGLKRLTPIQIKPQPVPPQPVVPKPAK